MRTPWTMATIVAAGLILSSLAAPVRAEDPMEEAKAHVAKAKVHYDLGEFEQAAEEYILVYRIKPIPAILFNIAQAYRQGGKYDKARQFYRSYLRATDDPKIQASVRKAIKELDELVAKEEKTKSMQPTGVTEPPSGSLVSKKDKEQADAGVAALEPPPTKPAPSKSAELAPPPGASKVEPPVAAKTPPAAPPGSGDLVPPAGSKPPDKPAPPPAPKTVALAPPPGPKPPEKVAPPPVPPPVKEAAAPKQAPAPTRAEGLAATGSRAAPAAALETRPAPERGSRPMRVVGWTAIGLSVAAAGAGTLFGLQAKSAGADWAGATTDAAWNSARDSAQSKSKLATISWVAAGVLAAAGVGAVLVF